MKSDSWTQGRRAVLGVAFSIVVASCLGAGLSAAAPRSLGLGGPVAPVIDGDGADLIDFAATIGEAGCAIDVDDNRDDLVLTDPKFISCAPHEDTDSPPDGVLDYFVNGFDLRRFVLAYDRPNKTLYVLWRTEGAIGDVEGNLSPDNAACEPPSPPYFDQAGIGSQETYQVYFDTNCDGTADIILAVGGGGGSDDVTIQGVSFGGSQLAYRQGVGTGKDLELKISGIDLPVSLRVFAYVNAVLDGMGEDVSARRTCGSPTPGIVCSIDAPDTRVCPGELVQICGPEGPYTWLWNTGATSRCIAVGAGSYSLVVGGGEAGCASEPCTVTVLADPAGCATGNCPRGVGFWTQQCAQKGNGSTKFTRAQMDQVAACVDETVASFSWSDDFDSFCRIMDPPGPMDQRKQAERQFVALAANSCTSRLGLTPSNGAPPLLDPNTPVNCSGFAARTIGQLIIEIDGTLVALESEDLNSGSVRTQYTNIISCTEAINTGVSIPTTATCEHGGTTSRSGLGGVGGSPVAVYGLELYKPFPNPFNTTTQFAFEVMQDEGASVDVTVYDVSGRQVRKLVTGRQPAGLQVTAWDGRSDEGVTVTRGVYFVRTVIAGTRAPIQRLLFVR